MRFLRTLSVFLLLPIMAGAQDPGPVEAGKAPYHISLIDDRSIAFVNVNIVPMDEKRILRDMALLVEGDRIVQIGPATQLDIPFSARIIYGRGKYLMPGLAEMHGHVPPVEDSNLPDRYVKDVLFLYLAGGVTTVRGMLGRPNQLLLKERVKSGELIGPTGRIDSALVAPAASDTNYRCEFRTTNKTSWPQGIAAWHGARKY